MPGSSDLRRLVPDRGLSTAAGQPGALADLASRWEKEQTTLGSGVYAGVYLDLNHESNQFLLVARSPALSGYTDLCALKLVWHLQSIYMRTSTNSAKLRKPPRTVKVEFDEC